MQTARMSAQPPQPAVTSPRSPGDPQSIGRKIPSNAAAAIPAGRFDRRQLGMSDAGGEQAPQTGSTFVGPPVERLMQRAGSINIDLRSLPQTAPVRLERPEREEPEVPHRTIETGTATNQRAVRSIPTVNAPAPAVTTSFAGLDYQNWGAGHPPDTNGDVGPTYYIQTINSSIGIYQKSGTPVVRLTFNQFMSQGHFGNLCDTANFGDPVALYDTFEDRWVVTDFAFQLSGNDVVNPPGSFECIAVSKTGDPVSGGWNFYSFNTTGGLGDYPKLGIWPDGLYMSVNMFNYAAAGGYIGPRVYAFNKTQMYAGAASAQFVTFDAPSSDFALLPANARLQTGTPPSGTPNFFVSTELFLNGLGIYKFHVDWDRISLSTFTGPFTATTNTSWPNASVPNAPSSGGNNLDVLQIRAMAQNQYANIAGVESIWTAHTVRRADTSGFAAPRWYQTTVTGGTVAGTLAQAATWDPDGANVMHRFMPSLAVDRAGNMALGYSTSSSSTKPAIKYAGRLTSDPVNTLGQTETTLIQGAGTQVTVPSTLTRWGDYSAMTLDPDGCTFWYTNMYYAADGINHQTQIGAFKYPSCTTVSTGTLSGTVRSSAAGNPVIAGATVSLGSRTTTTNGSGVYTFSGIPAGTYPTVTASPAGFTPQTFTSLVVTQGATTTRDFTETAAPSSGCFVDTAQGDFQAGVAANCDLTGTPGVVTLTNLPTINQQNATVTSNGFGFSSTAWAGQTFTPSAAGTLTRVDLNLFCSGCTGTTPNLTVSLRATSAGLPTGADLATATITGFSSSSGGLFAANFASPPTVTSGVQYAVIVRAVSNPSLGTYAYVCSCSGSSAGVDSSPYAGGARVTSGTSGSTWAADATTGGRDLGFAVYMQTGFSASGNFISSVKDANPATGQAPLWQTFGFSGTTPGGTTLRFQVGGSNSPYGPFSFVGPDATTNTFFTNGASLGQFSGYRYLQYKAIFTSNGAATPTLNDVTICFGSAVAPAITVNPASSTIHTGDTASMSVAASGSPAPTYQWYVGTSGNTSSPIGGATSSTYTTPAMTVSSRFWARATNFGGTADSADNLVQVVTYTLFTDNTLTAGVTPLKAVHVTELRTRIDQQRARVGLSGFAWTDPTLTGGATAIKAVHILEMRAAIVDLYARFNLTAPTFTDPSLTAGTAIKRVHIQELRDALVVIEGQ